ncbi:hypothetical protein [Acinetobacter sp. Leaf130]|uniref:hypothetical protein n=1 Tax=Acinetobacter sp. Leaf130 TaxID=1736269 RepID=UPI0006FDCC11|nr:hypothetical protein [Acinetobacter sp. Leaf130]KQQ77272.1 hypothetical protein ASF86_07135 [Acinetobacter sp. Leaf130]
MTNLISAQEAFNALQNGKEVLCSKLFENDFKTLESYPATIFVMPGYEFCIKAELMELAGIQFTKPLVAHEVEDDQEIFIVTPTRVLRTKFHPENCEIYYSVLNGFAQADAENAVLQLKALGAIFGQVIDHIDVEDGFNDKPKNQRGKRSSKASTQKQVEVTKAEDLPENMAIALDTAIVITEGSYVSSSEDLLVPVTNEPEVDPEYQKTLDTLLQRVKESKTPAEVNAVYRYTHAWSDKQMEPLLQATHKRLTQLADEKPVESEPPSLMVQIQNAPDLTTLDALEIDVASRALEIQPKLMGFVKKRRFELENPPVNEPDYLPEEPF